MIGWPNLPTVLAIPVLIGLREQLRSKNLYDTGRDQSPGPHMVAAQGLSARTVTGCQNNRSDPLMGAVGSRFGRNVPLTHAYREEPAALLHPNPRLVSRRLLTREQFQPATTLNVLAASWIQFEVHDWVSHGFTDQQPFLVPLAPDDPWPEEDLTASVAEHGSRDMVIKRTAPDPAPDSWGPPTFVTGDSHWWDASQIYGSTEGFADAIRGPRGRLLIDELGLPPEAAAKYADLSGAAGNFWVGLAILHSLFMREHNAICDRLEAEYPSMTDQQLYDTARLINAALIAKIHTVDWTPAIIAHPTTVFALRANWFGVLGERFAQRFGRIGTGALLGGIPGSVTQLHGVPYSLTEEFVAVYRMHPLIPDEFTFRSVADNAELVRHELTDLTVFEVRRRLSELSMADIFYSFGRAHPGALSLHNYPRTLQRLRKADGELVDLGAIDIMRTRERGVPRYNEFRRLFRLEPAASFEDLTDNPACAQELRDIYGDIERVDLMVGLYAERKPPGFGFSDTAFRVFILMASRRLESDRFFTTDFRPEIYTPGGMEWIKNNTMRTVLLRHFPTLEPALRGVANPFAPWQAVV
ncbi:peroxidase family protein [Mycobacterium sp. NPDC048908]|uniref:peroxidase family protein n=1 Tax=Mycobacterium sp. NPDC048908 TaxID=3364292 RepID=UPI00371F7134